MYTMVIRTEMAMCSPTQTTLKVIVIRYVTTPDTSMARLTEQRSLD
jgi:hypothetical protein